MQYISPSGIEARKAFEVLGCSWNKCLLNDFRKSVCLPLLASVALIFDRNEDRETTRRHGASPVDARWRSGQASRGFSGRRPFRRSRSGDRRTAPRTARSPTPSCTRLWFAHIRAVRLFPSLNHCPRMMRVRSAVARSTGSIAVRMIPLTVLSGSAGEGIGGIQSVPEMRTLEVPTLPGSAYSP